MMSITYTIVVIESIMLSVIILNAVVPLQEYSAVKSIVVNNFEF
jgi:hypothetical protein